MLAIDLARFDTQTARVDGTTSAPGHGAHDAHSLRARSTTTVPGQKPGGIQPLRAGDTITAADHSRLDTHRMSVDGMTPATPGQSPVDTQNNHVGRCADHSDARDGTNLTSEPMIATFRSLRVWAEMFHDFQKARIACANRAERGGVDPDTYRPQLEVMEQAEKVLGAAMRKEYRRSAPKAIVEWQKAQKGIGDHLLARLLGCIGHPRYAEPYHWEGTGAERVLIADEPFERRVSDLWSYCGHGDVTRKRRKGQTPEEAAAGGKPDAKMLVHLMAESCVKSGGPYRAIYDERRMDTAITHPEWTKGHSHNDALRVMGKAILRDLWAVSA